MSFRKKVLFSEARNFNAIYGRCQEIVKAKNEAISTHSHALYVANYHAKVMSIPLTFTVVMD